MNVRHATNKGKYKKKNSANIIYRYSSPFRHIFILTDGTQIAIGYSLQLKGL